MLKTVHICTVIVAKWQNAFLHYAYVVSGLRSNTALVLILSRHNESQY